MSEGGLDYQGLKIENITPREQFDPRVTKRFFVYPVEIKDSFLPDSTNYPGWRLTPIVATDQKIKPEIDGCIFEVAANTATPVGLVGESITAKEAKVNLSPEFIEWIITGSGKIEIEVPGSERETIEVDANKLVRFRYGKGTKVRYIAGPNGLVGVNIGIPAGIEENSITSF